MDGNDNNNGYFACYSTIISCVFFSRFTCLANMVDVQAASCKMCESQVVVRCYAQKKLLIRRA
jgi:hypothetical protein